MPYKSDSLLWILCKKQLGNHTKNKCVNDHASQKLEPFKRQRLQFHDKTERLKEVIYAKNYKTAIEKNHQIGKP